LSGYLTNWGMTVSTAADGESALTALESAAGEGSALRWCLLDRFIAGMDGLALKNAIVVDPGLATGVVVHDRLGPGA